MSIYTGGGDRGQTSLFSGERVPKDHQRVEAYGDVDELNSVLGLLSVSLEKEQADLLPEIRRIQAELFQVGAWLATPTSSLTEKLQPITIDHWQRLEKAIDRMTDCLPPLKGFILPGGHPSAAWAHLARTVCRRAERRVVAITSAFTPDSADDESNRNQGVLIYLNRLSDYLFVLARLCNQTTGHQDVEWTNGPQ